MKLISHYLILDVKRGRKGLNKALKNGPVMATVKVRITEAASHDDGVSQEFSCDVLDIHTIED